MFSLQVLFYGDHVRLSRRCLKSLKSNLSEQVSEIRIGLNAVCPETLELVHSLFADQPLPVWLYQSPVNVWKYPLMRRMFYDADRPINCPYICWFDDDSFFRSDNPQRWHQYATVMSTSDMLGRIYRRRFQGRMTDAVATQP